MSSKRIRKETPRYVAYRGLRMLQASRERTTKLREPKTVNSKVSSWLMSNTDCRVDSVFAEPADTSAVSLPAFGVDKRETAQHDRSVGRPPPDDVFLDQPAAAGDMVVDVNTEPTDTSAVSLPAFDDDKIETADRPPLHDVFLEQPAADMVVNVNTLNTEPTVACDEPVEERDVEPDEEIDVDVSSQVTCSSPEVVSLRNNDRKFRMMRRKRLNLRRKMLSFDPPEKVTIFRRLRFIHDSSDSSDAFASDGESIPVKPEDSKTSRKRVRNVEGWKRNKIKRARESGSAYISHRGVHVSVKKPCVKSCLCREKSLPLQ